jgi:phage shock protein C
MSRKHWKRAYGKHRGFGCGWKSGSASTAWGEGGFGGRNFRILSGLRRDPRNGRVSGVCAGIAGYYGINLTLIRLAMIVATFMNPFLTIGGYIIATFLLHPVAEPERGGPSEMNAGSTAQGNAAEEALPPELHFAALKDKFRELEERTGDIETLVTSSEFRLRRDFKQMGEGKDTGPTTPFGAGPAARPPMMGMIG